MNNHGDLIQKYKTLKKLLSGLKQDGVFKKNLKEATTFNSRRPYSS